MLLEPHSLDISRTGRRHPSSTARCARPAARRLLMLALCAALEMALCAASGAEYLIVPITLDHGLSQSSANCVIRDNKGYLWIGTEFGLNRYDKHQVKNYHAASDGSTLLSDQILTLALDPGGDLLVGTPRGLMRYDYPTDNFTALTADGVPVAAYSARQVQGGTLVGGRGALYMYDGGSRTLRRLPVRGMPADMIIYNISPQWRPGQYILSTRWDGLWIYDSHTATASRLPFCTERNIRAVTVGSDGSLWAAPFNRGIEHYDRDGRLDCRIDQATSGLSSDIVLDITEFEGRIWVATERGVDVIDPLTHMLTPLRSLASVPANCTVLCLTPGENGAIYAGTLRHGVMCVYQVPMRTFTQHDDRSIYYAFTVTFLLPDPATGKVWIATDGEGVALFDPVNGTMTQMTATDGMKVTSLADYDDRHLLMVNYGNNYYLLDKQTGALSDVSDRYAGIQDVSLYPAVAVELYNMRNGRIAAAFDGVCTFDPATGGIREPVYTSGRPGSNKLNPFYCDGRFLMLNDRRRVYRYDAEADTCGVVHAEDADLISCAAYDGKGILWLATPRGLERNDMRRHTTTVIQPEYIRNITSLAVEGDRLWVGADNRLYMLNGDNVTAFGPTDGVTSNQFINKARLLTDDYLLLGGVNGLVKINRLDIDRLEEAPAMSEIYLSELLVDNGHTTVGDDGRVEIPREHSTVTVRIIDHEDSGMPNKLFRYTVSGYGRDLVTETFDRYISLGMLQPGTYTVSVSYSRGGGDWSEPVRLVEIHVPGPWWKSWWAILGAVVLLALVLAASRVVMRNRKRRRDEQGRRALLQERVDFLQGIHSRLRTPLTTIISPIKSLIDKTEADGGRDDGTIECLRSVYDSSLQMRDIIDTLPESADLSSFMESRRGDKAVAPAEDHADGGDFSAGFDTQPYSVLVVEDDPKVSDLLAAGLGEAFNKVITSTTAEEGLRALKEQQPDIIVADTALPGCDGFEFCGRVKATEDIRHIPVILLTSGNNSAEKMRSYAQGADSYISKPFDMDMVVNGCRNLLLTRSIMRSRYDRGAGSASRHAGQELTNSDETFIMELDRLMAENIQEPDFGVDFLARRMLMSRTTLYNRVKQVTGMSVGQYISDYRLEQARRLLSDGRRSLAEIAEALGFKSQRYFSMFFKEKTGMSPTEFRNRAQNSTDAGSGRQL